ncbi:MAG: galactose-1-epimerase, partial [Muribaculaceae bacterium]|nr:galactose-1-epimerase [Muribaculaceae bacterium]
MTITKETIESAKGRFNIYTLVNATGAAVRLSEIGAGIVALTAPDGHGRLADVVLGYAQPTDYFYDGPCAGKIPGRYANRIARGQFSLDGTDYQLAINNGPNALHGGPEGFSNKIWQSEPTESGVVFTLTSPDGDENYPGTLQVRAEYTWNDKNELRLDISAT